MKHRHLIAAALACSFAFAGATNAFAQSGERMKDNLQDFIRTHYFDDTMTRWVLKDGMEPPMGVKTRAEVIKERDEFLRMNHFDTVLSRWTPNANNQPRDMSKLTREQVEMETRMFLMSYHFDSIAGKYVPIVR